MWPSQSLSWFNLLLQCLSPIDWFLLSDSLSRKKSFILSEINFENWLCVFHRAYLSFITEESVFHAAKFLAIDKIKRKVNLFFAFFDCQLKKSSLEVFHLKFFRLKNKTNVFQIFCAQVFQQFPHRKIEHNCLSEIKSFKLFYLSLSWQIRCLSDFEIALQPFFISNHRSTINPFKIQLVFDTLQSNIAAGYLDTSFVQWLKISIGMQNTSYRSSRLLWYICFTFPWKKKKQIQFA